MTTEARSLGEWETYTPNPWPKGIPPDVLFCKRKADGSDWYALCKTLRPGVYAVAAHENGQLVVKVATRDPTRLWPGELTLLSIADDQVSDPQTYVGKVWSAGKIVDAPSVSTE